MGALKAEMIYLYLLQIW